MLLPHGKELIGFVPFSELYTTYADHHRLQVFAEKGTVCVSCGRVGTLLALGREMQNYKQYRKRGTVGAVHIDLYTDDFVLMTVDHIVPKKVCKELGLSTVIMESLDNKQTMCDPCNGSKGHKMFSPEEQASFLRQMENNRKQSKQYKDSQALLSLIPNIHSLLGDVNVLA